jgi:hypothetical protein
VSLAQAFSNGYQRSGQCSSLTEKDGVGNVTIDASYTEDQPFVINTLKGSVAIERIKFKGTLQAIKSVMPLDNRVRIQVAGYN